MTVDAEPGSEGWQFLCHVRNRWKEVSEEEAAFLDAAWSSGQKSCDYRLKNGVPMKVDFAAKAGWKKQGVVRWCKSVVRIRSVI